MLILDFFEKLFSQNAIISVISFALSVIAITLSLRGEHVDRINTNTWEIYSAYNSEEVRAGRDLSRQMLRDPNFQGFASYADYQRYFGLAPYGDGTTPLSQQRQHIHDLAAFYHQTGVLMQRRRLDKDFTLLMVGPGLEDRWPILRGFASFYSDRESSPHFAYGGIYILFLAYEKWKRSRYKRLTRRFIRLQRKVNRLVPHHENGVVLVTASEQTPAQSS